MAVNSAMVSEQTFADWLNAQNDDRYESKEAIEYALSKWSSAEFFAHRNGSVNQFTPQGGVGWVIYQMEGTRMFASAQLSELHDLYGTQIQDSISSTCQQTFKPVATLTS